ncbi:MAG: hypothetical protein U1F61_03610 [Opitutaceae bacterium]
MATGSHWDLVQVVAWARMFAGYSEVMSLSEAAAKTFAGETCTLCQLAQDGKQQQQQGSKERSTPPPASSAKAVEFCPLTADAVVLPPLAKPVGLLAAIVAPEGRGRASPPIPPPRA